MDITQIPSCSRAVDLDMTLGGSASPRWQHRPPVSACSWPLSCLQFLFTPQCTNRSASLSLPFSHHKPVHLSGTRSSSQTTGCRLALYTFSSPLASPLIPFLFPTAQIVSLLFSHLYVSLFGAPVSLNTVAYRSICNG